LCLLRPVTALHANQDGKSRADLPDDYAVNGYGCLGNALQQADHESFSGRGLARF